MLRIVLATTNHGKVHELRHAFASAGVSVGVVSLDQFSAEAGRPIPSVTEDGLTFAENAQLKADAYHMWSGLPCLADDSGLVVEALRGAPGVHSARFAAEDFIPQDNASSRDRKNTQKLLTELQCHAPPWHAYFETTLVYRSNHHTRPFSGTCAGSIVATPRGSTGFGYDPVFVPTGSTTTFAEMGDEKNAISHRALAFAEFVKWLKTSPSV